MTTVPGLVGAGSGAGTRTPDTRIMIPLHKCRNPEKNGTFGGCLNTGLTNPAAKDDAPDSPPGAAVTVADLTEAVEVCPDLPEPIRAAMLALLRTIAP